MAKFGLNEDDSSSEQSSEEVSVDDTEDQSMDQDDATYQGTVNADEDEDEEDEQDDEDAPPMDVLDDEEEQGGLEYHPLRYQVDDEPRSRSSTPAGLPASRRGSRQDRARIGHAPEPESPRVTRDSGRSWRAELGLQPQKVALMQRSLFASPADQAVPTAPVSRETSVKPRKVPLSITAPTKTKATEPKQALRRPLRRPREKARIALAKSYSSGKESSLVDASLALCRSFRVSWGPGNRLVCRGTIGNKASASTSSDLFIGQVPTLSQLRAKETAAALRLLKVQLQNSVISSTEGVPSASPSPSLRFRHFRWAFAADDTSHEALLWRLGSALFDEIDLRLPRHVTTEAANRISNVRREDAFSSWLQQAVAPAVEHDVRQSPRPGPDQTFKLLTGFQLDRACNAAVASGDLRLSTLVALAGGDAAYKSDVLDQLRHWREKRVDGHVDPWRRRILELLCGNVLVSKGYGRVGLHVDASADLDVAEGLDWKRTFGLHFWYQASHVNLRYAVDTYEKAFREQKLARPPLPWYIERPPPNASATEQGGLKRWEMGGKEETLDPLFHLIKMAVEPTHELETALQPRGFCPSPFDYRMPWHLYVLLAKAMDKKDFGDREVSMDRDGERGNSAKADQITTDYADQLEVLGLWEWSAFVLMHLELADSREQALHALFARNISTLDDPKTSFLLESLHLPPSWLALAQASLAKHQDRLFEAFELLRDAGDLDGAHRIVVAELAPEALIHEDLEALGSLFEGMGPENVGDWPYGGQLFVDYADLFDALTKLVNSAHGGEEDQDAAVDQMVERDLPALLRELPTLYTKRGRTPTTKQTVAVGEMISRLNGLASEAARLRGKQRTDAVDLDHLHGSDRLASVMQGAEDALSLALVDACS